jgi:glycosyltransferase involved in cell wall biosynthesis
MSVLISIVVIGFNIPRELPRTLYSLSNQYQRGIQPEQYEIILVDNGSSPPIDEAVFAGLRGQFHLHRFSAPHPSPVAAINYGISMAKGDVIGVLIDGARIVTPQLLSFALLGCQLNPAHAVVATLGWYLGADYQRRAMQCGYTKEQEDSLLKQIDWQADGYRLFEISAMDESSVDGWTKPIAESNAIFMHRSKWQRLGGYDPLFDMPGGGLANLDLYKRAIDEPASRLVLLLGEATFHQLHGGVSTNVDASKAIADWDVMHAQYIHIRGHTFAAPVPIQAPVYLGSAPASIRKHIFRSIAFSPNASSEHPLGKDFSLEGWAFEAEVVKDGSLEMALNILKKAIQLGEFEAAATVARVIRCHYPMCATNLRVLSLVSPWLPLQGESTTSSSSFQLLVDEVNQLLG